MNIIESINEIVINLISSAGYLGIFISMLIEGILTPIPSELIMPFAGYLSSIGQLNVVLVILSGSLGAVIGSTVAFYIGNKLGRGFLDRWGRYLGIGEDKLCEAEAWFARWGSYGILIGHALPGVRSIISFPAGILKMNVRKFALFTFLGATIWNTVLVAAGFLLGQYWIELSRMLDGWDLVILAVVGAAVIAYVIYKRMKSKQATKCKEN